MPVVIPPGFAEVTVNFRPATNGEPAHSVYGVDLSDVLDQTDVDSLSTALAAAYKPQIGLNGFYDGVRVLEGQDGTPPLIWSSTSGAGAGSKTGSLCTPQVQALIRKGTGFASRKGIGRTFVPDVQENSVTDAGGLSAGAITALTDFANAVITALATAPWSGMVILHQDATIPFPVTTFSAESKVATLRGRYTR